MIQFRRGTASAASTANEVLAAGQPFVETDTSKLKIGDGSTAFNDLPYIGGSGGKKYATVVVGTSTAGYTADQVDFLCDGVDDQVEINEAFDSIKQIGGSINLLNGEYNITDRIGTSVSGFNPKYIKICGNGSTINVIYPASPENTMALYLLVNRYEISNLTIHVDNTLGGCQRIVYASKIDFHDCTVIVENNTYNGFRIVDTAGDYSKLTNNVFIYDSTSSDISNSGTSLLYLKDYTVISNNIFQLDSPVDTVLGAKDYCSISNNIFEGTFYQAIDAGGHGNGLKFGTISGNCIDCDYSPSSTPAGSAALITAGAGIAVTGNSINMRGQNVRGISVTQGNAGDAGGTITGNVVYGGYSSLVTDDNTVITGNMLAKQTNNSIMSRSYLDPKYVVIVGNRVGNSLSNMDGTGTVSYGNVEQVSFE